MTHDAYQELLSYPSDDIPIIQKDESEGGAGADVSKPLTSITEEKEDTKFSLRGNSGRSKETVSKNLQKLVTGKKFKEKDKEGKSSSKSSLVATGTSANNRKQSGLLQLSTFKEKVSLKSGGSEKGDFGVTETVNGHSPSFGRVKAAENGPGGEASGEEISESLGCQSSLNSDNLDTPSSTDVVGFFGTPKNSDEKPFTRVSSV
ncbi:hypothetical protein RUM43_005483 [Polyplax serrata]|uniref:Uncharacterized protein n=1 Tax=Polyplax serrata TaxID=468196 RepID=A0AAN8NW47_POLSC